MHHHSDYVDSFKQDLIRNLKIDLYVESGFDDAQVQAVIDEIDSYGDTLSQKVLSLCLSMSYARASLVVNALKHVRDASYHLDKKDLERWVGTALSHLDQGIAPTLDFLTRTDRKSMSLFKGRQGLYLEEHIGTLEKYLRGISGEELRIEPADVPYTDTETVYLPHFVGQFRGEEKNFLLYKLMVAFKFAQIAQDGLILPRRVFGRFPGMAEKKDPDIATLFDLFDDRELAIDIYTVIEGIRQEAFLSRDLPGLMRDFPAIRKEMLDQRPLPEGLSEKEAFVEGLYRSYLNGGRVCEGDVPSGDDLNGILPNHSKLSIDESIEALVRLYEHAAACKGEYSRRVPIPYLGIIRPEKVSLSLARRRETLRRRLDTVINRLMTLPEAEIDKLQGGKGKYREYHERKQYDQGDFLQIRGRLFEIDEEIHEIIRERGGIPGGLLMEGRSAKDATTFVVLRDLLELEGEAATSEGLKYDEWDYRRGDYRKDWCSLFERDVRPGGEPFVQLTLGRYGGYVKALRRKFELLRKEPRLLRRQKEGDEIDLDATVQSFADHCAGVSPSEDVFMRRDRQERDIAALFLIDMSGSTKGWVSEAQKEALVLMCEALDALGDRHAIYGFSGMTRNKCEVYRIKRFDESYDEQVKARISGIEPKDYTRMGPAVRHAAAILRRIDARSRIMIVLSDGKPEDWDAYKGLYGIEDTRRALVEAKELGIHVFCITIDREASAYIPLLFGDVNYIILDDVRKLPNRITEIYRRLTT